ncbi:MAG: glycosyltransferase family 39 protein [Candidatus Hydrogenedentes bacterium]|nr:glycosyltransferase family 39 protein [Candidatus Hydrogenedentota bacterium]
MNHDEDSLPIIDPEKPRGSGWAWLLLLALLTFHALMNIWWLRADNHAIFTDEEGHMLKARQYHEALFANTDATLVERLVESTHVPLGNPAHPPLLHLLAALNIEIFGYSPDTIALTMTYAFLLAIVGVYALSRCFLSPLQAWFAATVFSFVPVVFASSRFFMTDYLAMTLVIWAVYCLVRSGWFQHSGWILCFALLNGLGILTRVIAPIYYIVPLLLVCAGGAVIGVRALFADPRDFHPLGRIVLNTFIALVVSAGVSTWWYLDNLEDLDTFWSSVHNRGKGVPLAFTETAAPPVEAVPPAPPAPATPSAPATPATPTVEVPVVPSPATAPLWESNPILRGIVSPQMGWAQYPIYVVNNGAFLVLTILMILGAVSVLFVPGFRRAEAFVLILWLLGSWFLLTALFNFGNPRYAIPAMPALGILAALPVLMLPWSGFRAVAGVVLVGMLLFQYGNLSYKSYGVLGSQFLPWKWNEEKLRVLNDPGIAVYKDTISLSVAYSQIEAPTQENFKEDVFNAIMEAERSNPFPAGEYANYLRLGFRGGEFYDRHYWPEPNPYRMPRLEAGFPERRIRDLGLEYTPERVSLLLPEADYLIYSLPPWRTEQARQWIKFFAERGFRLVEEFETKAVGDTPPERIGLLAKDHAAIIGQMDAGELIAFRSRPEYNQMADSLYKATEARFQALVNPNNSSIPMSGPVSFVSIGVDPGSERGAHLVTITLKIDRPVEQEYTIGMHGIPESEASLKETMGIISGAGFDWGFSPTPPSSAWRPDNYVRLQKTVEALPGVYTVRVELLNAAKIVDGFPVTVPFVNFREAPVERTEASTGINITNP